jgi:hypothetical protein
MQGVPPSDAWRIVNKPEIPEMKLGWNAELIRDLLAKRNYEISLRAVDDPLSVLHESGRVSKTVGDFGFDTYELIGARIGQPK